MRRRPYSVVLFDEIEKAHEDIFNLMLQILDDGRLTDSKGRLVNFKNTIIIMTSNVGAAAPQVKNRLGFLGEGSDEFGYEQMRESILSGLRKKFRPEFLNRVDDIIVFHKLNDENIRHIAERMLDTLAARMSSLGITLRINSGVAETIAKEGLDPAYGARPLRRAIQSRIEDPLSEALLEGRFKQGDAVLCSFDGSNFVFS